MQVRLEQIKQDDKVSKQRKCQLLEVNRSRLYYKKKPISEHDIELMNEMRDIYIQYPFFGYRKIHAILGRNGYNHNIKKTERLASLACLKALYPKKKTTIRDKTHSVFPYLLKNMDIIRPHMLKVKNHHIYSWHRRKYYSITYCAYSGTWNYW